MAEAPKTQPYVVFARRWRPQTFDEVVGQDHISQQLKNSVASSRVGHSFLFRGPRGVGKTSMARILAKALNCVDGPTPTPCGKCAHCRNIASGNAMDVIEIDAATHTQVEEMRSILATVSYAPASMRFKIYIVDEVHMLSKHSFNSLLKTLEEPPAAVKFIFATTDPEKIPETIRSRCQDFEFRRIGTAEIAQRLDQILSHEKSVEVSDEERPQIMEALARHAEGGMRDAQVALDQLISLTSGKLTLDATRQLLGVIEDRLLLETAKALQSGDTPRLLRIVDGLVESGSDLEAYVKSLMQFVRDLTVLKCAPSCEQLTDIPSTQMDAVQAALVDIQMATLLNLAQGLFALAEQMKATGHTRYLLEFFFIKMTTIASTRSIDDVIRALESGQSLPAPSAPSPHGAAPSAAAHAMAPTSDPLASPPPAVARVLKKVADPTDVQMLWRELTGLLWSQDMRMRQFLEHSHPLSSTGNTLKIGFTRDQSYARERLRRAENQQKIIELLEQLTGQTWRLQLVEVEEESAKSPPPDVAESAAPPEPDESPPAEEDSGSLEPEPMLEEEMPPEPDSPSPSAPPSTKRSLRVREVMTRHPFLRHLCDSFKCTDARFARPNP
jgi:DNA polymerase III subunit gamma/tau